MRLSALILSIAALAVLPLVSHAYAQDGDFDLELNNVKPVQNGCRVVFVAVNRLGTQLDKMAVEIGVFDEKGIFSDMVVFDFGRLPAGKTKVVQYDLPRECTTISRLLLNSVKECAGQKDMRQECEDRIKTRSLVNIGFGQ
jgi:hypothetical protein